MRLSTTINFFIEPDLRSLKACQEDLERYASLGYTCLDAIFCSAGAQGSMLREPDWEKFVTALRKTADSLSITFVQSHIPFYNFTLPDAKPCADADLINERSILSAAILGAKWTVAHPATALNSSMVMEDSKRANLEFYSPLLTLAERQGIGIALENMADFEGGGRNRWYCAYVEELCDLIDTLAQTHPNVGACWDFGHANLIYRSQARALKYLGDRLKVTHVHDNSGRADEHLSPFRGTVDWFEIMRTLAQTGYDRDFSFEVRRIVRTDVPESVKNSLWSHLKVVGSFLIGLYDAERASCHAK